MESQFTFNWQFRVLALILAIVVTSFMELLFCAMIYALTSYHRLYDVDLDLFRSFMNGIPFGILLTLCVLNAFLGIAFIAVLVGHLEKKRFLDIHDKIAFIPILLFFVGIYTFLNELPSPESTRLPQNFCTKGNCFKNIKKKKMH